MAEEDFQLEVIVIFAFFLFCFGICVIDGWRVFFERCEDSMRRLGGLHIHFGCLVIFEELSCTMNEFSSSESVELCMFK